MERGGRRVSAAGVLAIPFGGELVVLLFPWLITGWHSGVPSYPTALRILGIALIAVGSTVNITTLIQLSIAGRRGPSRVMARGPYRYMRHPMYGSYVVTIIGEAVFLTRPVLLVYAAAILAALMLLVHLDEERAMSRRFGPAYDAYRASVPGWWPRWRSGPRSGRATTVGGP